MSFAVVVAGYDKNFWFKCKGCFCFLLYYGMLFIQVFAATSITTWLLCLNFCNTDTESETLLLLYITFKHPCMTEVMKVQSIGSAAHCECVIEPCCWWAEDGRTPPTSFSASCCFHGNHCTITHDISFSLFSHTVEWHGKKNKLCRVQL